MIVHNFVLEYMMMHSFFDDIEQHDLSKNEIYLSFNTHLNVSLFRVQYIGYKHDTLYSTSQ